MWKYWRLAGDYEVAANSLAFVGQAIIFSGETPKVVDEAITLLMGESSLITTFGEDVLVAAAITSLTHSLMVTGGDYASTELPGNQLMVPSPCSGKSPKMYTWWLCQ